MPAQVAIPYTVYCSLIFRKNGVWAYRSNEFSNTRYEHSLDTLKIQAMQIRSLVALTLGHQEFTCGCSLEKVHAIWRVS